MDYAKERRSSDTYIWAHDARPSRSYICPTCSADVILRRGRWRVAHFAHRPGTGKPECENFHPAGGITYAWPPGTVATGAGPSYRPSEPLRLGIEIQPEYLVRGRHLRGWELRITIPKSEDTHGQITFDCGGGVKRKVPLLKLALASQSYPVDLDTEDFGAVWVSPEVKPEYREVVEDRVRGLDRELGTLFSSTQQRIKPRVDRALWGGSYYLVWHDAFDLGQPRQLVAQPLAKAGHWNCIFITLPDEEDAELKSWLEGATAVSLSAYRRIFGVIYPPPVGYDVLGRLSVPTSDEIVVGLRQTEDDSGQTGEFRATAGNSCSQVTVEGAGRHLLRIALEATKAHVSLSLDEMALPPLVPVPLSTEDVFPAARIHTCDGNTGKVAQSALGSRDGGVALSAVRAGHVTLSKLFLPSGAKGRLRWKRRTSLIWDCRALGYEGLSANVELSAEDIDQLNCILRDASLDVDLDFGAFGQFTALSEELSRTPNPQFISAEIRQRLNWLLLASAIYADKRGIPVKRLSDEDALALLTRHPVATRLAPHQRWVLSQVARDSALEVRP